MRMGHGQRLAAEAVGSGGDVAAAWYSSRVGISGSFFFEMGRSLYNELDKLDPATQGQVYNSNRNDVRYTVNVQQQSEVALNYATLRSY